jgi:DNA-binding response OmpR family regulator
MFNNVQHSKQINYPVIAFNDPEEALSNFMSDSYALLLLDIRMPKINGFELCKKLREKDKSLFSNSV